MKVKYEGHSYNVKFFDAVNILYLEIVLKFKRAWRLLIRLIHYMLNIFPVVICLIIYVVFVYFWGKALFLNFSINETLWESKTVIFTSLLLAFFINATSKEKDRHQKLIERHDFYVDTMDVSEEIIFKMGSCLNYNFKNKNFLYTRRDYDNADNVIKKERLVNKEMLTSSATNSRKSIPLSEICSDFKDKISKILEQLKQFYLKDEDSGIFSYCGRNLLYNINNFIEEYENSDKMYATYQLVNIYSFILRDAFFFMEQLRHPWRIDYRINQRIRELIYKNDTSAVNLGTYIKMHLGLS